MLKNAIAYLITPGFVLDVELLARMPALPCSPTQGRTVGFTKPCEHANDDFVHRVGGISLICLETEDRLLPSSVIAEEVAERCAALEAAQGFKPGRGQLREIKEKVVTELLPKAFTQKRRTLAAFTSKYFIIDTSSPARADAVIETLKLAIDALPFAPIRTKRRINGAMMMWLLGDRPPLLSVDDFVELEKVEAHKPAIAYKRVMLDASDMRRRMEDQYVPRKIGVTYNDRMSFKLDENLHIKQLAVLDILKEKAAEGAQHQSEVFDAETLIVISELVNAYDYLIDELGGLEEPEPDLLTSAEPAGNESDSEDPLYLDAVKVVISNARASISLVQRHLQIGYNRAARLVEDMERAGIVSAMDASGVRRVLKTMEAA